MNKRNSWLAESTIFIALIFIISTWTFQARAIHLVSIDPIEQEQIKDTVKAYFDIRYRSFNTLELEDFGTLVDRSSQGNIFLRSESDKLEIELRHAKLNHLRYLQYKYFLDFKDISLDSHKEIVTITVLEGHDVEFEISKKISKVGPVISKMRNLQHSMVLLKENGDWKLVSDNYEDYLWRLIKETALSKEEYLRLTDDIKTDYLRDLMSESEGYSISSPACNLYYDGPTYPYNRDGAVSYAHIWSTAPRPYHHPPYDDFTDEKWGDCTNIVSQAIYEGGGALMVFDTDGPGIGQDGWYYDNINNRAAAWLDVGRLSSFIVNEWDFWETGGPEGCESVIDQAEKGDIIQYNWKENEQGTPDPNDEVWDHGVMIVLSQYEPTYHWVAGHTPDIDSYPYTHFIYTHPNMITRFIHIVRLDGNRVLLPTVLNYSGVTASQTQNMPFSFPNSEALNGEELLSSSPYPMPMEFNEPSLLSPYPAP